MDQNSEVKNYKGVLYYKSEDKPDTFFYLPGDPVPERNSEGRPTLSLFVSDQGGMLQLGSKWTVETDTLESLRDLIREEHELDPSLIMLSQVNASIDKVTLALGDGEKEFEDLATSASSGFPPYTALFNVQLTKEQKAPVMTSINGREKFLEVRYDIKLTFPVTAKVKISGDMKEDLETNKEELSPEDSMILIKNALSEGRLKIERSASEGTPDGLMEKAELMAHEEAARLIRQMSAKSETGIEESTIEATSSLTEMKDIQIKRITDVSSWFPEGTGSDHVQVLPVSVVDSETHVKQVGEKTIKLGFEEREIPVAFIEVISGEEKVFFRSPSFEPVSLPMDKVGKVLEIKTQYNIGGSPYKSEIQVEGSEHILLQPFHLGLMKVVVDGSRPHDKGSRKARVEVRYRAQGEGTEEDKTIYFRRDDWISSWFIVTRSENLAGVLEWEWKETTNDGSIIRHPVKTTDETKLIL
jgi:hypothetical protein